MENNLSQIQFKNMKGQTSTLNDFKGQVLLIVNVASQCGLTPQYDKLEQIYEKYQELGFKVLGFPANEFGAQEPGSNSEIMEFCETRFNVKFPMFEKIVVKGPGQHPLYQQLTTAIPQATQKSDSKLKARLQEKGLLSGESHDITWNFEKFLINRRGQVVARFAPDVAPDDPALISQIESELYQR